MSFYTFRTVVHPRSGDIARGETITVSGCSVQTLHVFLPEAAGAAHRVTFDQAAAMLATLPRMFIEPDGALVWTGDDEGQPWQVDGLLVDQGPRLAYVELSGRCPPNEFDQLLAPLGWPAAPLIFQLVPAGLFVDEQEFRRLASALGYRLSAIGYRPEGSRADS
jgi:hypothetical protein